MTKTQEYNSEMPSVLDLRDKVSIELWSCPEFSIQGVLFPGNKLHLHSDWPGPHKLTPSLLKKVYNALANIKASCHEQGIDNLYCLVPLSLMKWEQVLGFQPVEEWTNRLGGENLVLMKQETSYGR